MQIASFHLHNKVYAASVYGGREDSLGLTILLTVRMFFLFVLVLWCIYPNGALECATATKLFHYPTQIVSLMCMDFVNSVVDMIICAVMPRKIQNKYEQKSVAVGSEADKFY
jgi:predicted subunit of tRNA(5-methylaminomethyl-2-thiouridylate) methyltransferase